MTGQKHGESKTRAGPERSSSYLYKKLSYRRVTARCVLSVVILPITTQQCRNSLYDVMDMSSYRPMGASVARLIILISGARSRSWN